jgi:Cft2 family RNA processing exonuclease
MISVSANQMYKQSKSSLTFKEWLKDTQNKGILENHEKMYNMIDEAEKESTSMTTQQGTKKLGTINLIGIIGIVVLIYGLSKVTSAE